MLVERAISAEAAERARISLEKQVAEQAGKAQNEPPQASQATNPPQIMHKLGLTAEVHNAINELTRVSKRARDVWDVGRAEKSRYSLDAPLPTCSL
jgi:hypothetical protein